MENNELNKDNDAVQAEKSGEEGRYLAFALGEQSFAVVISFVKEIVEVMPITRVPNIPECIKGVVNLRGMIVPVVDLRLRFGMEEREYDERTCTIIIETGNIIVGFIVDFVEEILTIADDEVMHPAVSDYGIKNQFIKGIGRANDTVQLILDCEKVMDLAV